ncbi:hypothetical protein APHAL10511_005072 [Amanita phalloides]|nr:hypothetical protein APHAL10511_005072 [Amanita phalloides]
MLRISYNLSVPALQDAELNKAHQFPVEGDKASYKNYYVGLRAALAEARSAVGDELTKWKELVGKDEEWKMGGKHSNDIDEGSSDEEEPQVLNTIRFIHEPSAKSRQ